MKAQSQDTTICQTCSYAPECVHYQNSQAACKPIWFCENFNNTDSLQAAGNEESYFEARSSRSSNPGIEEIPGRMKGLCINCDNRVACLFPVVEGGIWHCEVYC